MSGTIYDSLTGWLNNCDKRDSNPERKEAKRQTMKKVDAKRAGKPERKEVQKKAKKKYLLTPKGLLAKLQENQRQREKLEKEHFSILVILSDML